MSSRSKTTFEELRQEFQQIDEVYYQDAIEKFKKKIDPDIQQCRIALKQHEIESLQKIKQMHKNNDNKRQQMMNLKQELAKTKNKRFVLPEWLGNDEKAERLRQQSLEKNENERQQKTKTITFNNPPTFNKKNICSIILNNMHETITDMVTETQQN